MTTFKATCFLYLATSLPSLALPQSIESVFSFGEIGGICVASGNLTASSGFPSTTAAVRSLCFKDLEMEGEEGSSLELMLLGAFDDGSFLGRSAFAFVVFTLDTGRSLDEVGVGSTQASTLAIPFVYETREYRLIANAGSLSTTASLAISNLGDDDYGLYADDSLPDFWQVEHFGEENPQGKASQDPDLDGQGNRFEFSAGTDPTNKDSYFRFWISQRQDVFELQWWPVNEGSMYSLWSSDTLEKDSWTLLGEVSSGVSFNQKESELFYRLSITRR